MKQIQAIGWDEVREYYLSFGEGPWLDHHRPMLDLVAWLERETPKEIFGNVGLHGLYLADRPQFGWCEHMLQITMLPTPGLTCFEYHRTPGALDGMRKVVPTTEAVECLRLFLALKFGVRRPPARNAQTSA